MDLHHSWGGPFAAGKNVLFSRQSSKKSVNLGTLPVFEFCHQTPCEKHPYLFPDLFFPLILLSSFPDYDLKGGPPFPLMKPRITAIFYVCAFAT